MDDLLDDAARRARHYLSGLDARPVFPSDAMRARLGELGGPLPVDPAPARDVLALLDDAASPATVASAGRRYFGFVTGGALPAIQAGNVNSGAFDPAADVCAAAHDARAWVHVDGAFGLWAAACPSLAHLARGVADADSWATDAHKWLNEPYDSGLAFVRNAAALRDALAIAAPYLPQDAPREPGDFTPEASRRARAVEVWAALRSLGSRGLAELIERNCRQARHFAERLAAAGHEILNDVVLNQVVVSFGDAARTSAILARIAADGTCWCGPTHWRGRPAVRISVSSWATADADVERSVAAILAAAAATAT